MINHKKRYLNFITVRTAIMIRLQSRLGLSLFDKLRRAFMAGQPTSRMAHISTPLAASDSSDKAPTLKLYGSPAFDALGTAEDPETERGSSPNWELVWQEGVASGACFDVSTPSKALLTLLENANLPPSKALVPGCGRGYDVAAFASYGHDAVGLELSETALLEARKYLDAFQPKAGAKTGKMELRSGNFFELEEKFDIIYDYTFSCGA